MPYIGNTPALDYISFAVQNFTVTAGTTVYTLDYSVSNENDIALYINSVAQRPGASFAYSATGTTLTLTSATLATDTMYAVFIGRAVQTVVPPASSVTNTMLSPSVITGQTAVTVPATDDVLLCYDTSATALRKITFADFGSTPAFEAHLSASQTGIADATYAKVNNNTEVFDTDNAYDNSVNYRFTPLVAGKYFVYSCINITGSVGNAIINSQNAIYKNGSAYRTIDTNPGETVANYNAVSAFNYAIIDMNGTTDYLELFGRTDVSSGTVTFLFNNSVKSTFFGAYRLIGV